MKIVKYLLPTLAGSALAFLSCNGGPPANPTIQNVPQSSSSESAAIEFIRGGLGTIPINSSIVLTNNELDIYSVVIPTIINTFPYRTSMKKSADAPLGLNRMPTTQIILRTTTYPAYDSLASLEASKSRIADLLATSMQGLVNQTMIDGYINGNKELAAIPAQMFDEKKVLNFTTANIALFKADAGTQSSILTWWNQLETTFPSVGALVAISRAGFDPQRKKALVSVTASQGYGPPVRYFYLLESYQNNWVITHSITF